MFNKNIGKVKFKLWRLKVKCIGYGWQVKNAACQNAIFIDEKDIRIKNIKNNISDSIMVYGFICPVCGCFTVISESKIPKRVKKNAKELVA